MEYNDVLKKIVDVLDAAYIAKERYKELSVGTAETNPKKSKSYKAKACGISEFIMVLEDEFSELIGYEPIN